MSTDNINDLQTDIITAMRAVEAVEQEINDHKFVSAYELQMAPQVKAALKKLEDLERLRRSRRQTYADAIIALENYKN